MDRMSRLEALVTHQQKIIKNLYLCFVALVQDPLFNARASKTSALEDILTEIEGLFDF